MLEFCSEMKVSFQSSYWSIKSEDLSESLFTLFTFQASSDVWPRSLTQERIGLPKNPKIFWDEEGPLNMWDFVRNWTRENEFRREDWKLNNEEEVSKKKILRFFQIEKGN